MAPEALARVLGKGAKKEVVTGRATSRYEVLWRQRSGAGSWAVGEGKARRAPPCSFLTCLLTSSRLRATPLSALLLLASFWHFPRLHSLCFITYEGWGGVGWLEPRLSPGSHPAALPYLVGIVEELQHREDAGPDEQTHLAPDVT